MNRHIKTSIVAKKAVEYLRENHLLLEEMNVDDVAKYIAEIHDYHYSLKKLANKIIYFWGSRES